MKKWLKTVFKRIGDLIVKLISVKTVAAVVVTLMGMKNNSVVAMIVVGLFWCLVVGLRYFEKVNTDLYKYAKFGQAIPDGITFDKPISGTGYERK